MKHDYTLTEEFQQNHFLVGLLLHEVKGTLNEVQDVRRFAIGTLRNLLAKHAFDNRYANKVSCAMERWMRFFTFQLDTVAEKRFAVKRVFLIW